MRWEAFTNGSGGYPGQELKASAWPAPLGSGKIYDHVVHSHILGSSKNECCRFCELLEIPTVYGICNKPHLRMLVSQQNAECRMPDATANKT